MFSTFDCAVKGFRQKEDAWNAIISGFMTGGCLAARSESLFFPACRVVPVVDSFQIDGFSIGLFIYLSRLPTMIFADTLLPRRSKSCFRVCCCVRNLTRSI